MSVELRMGQHPSLHVCISCRHRRAVCTVWKSAVLNDLQQLEDSSKRLGINGKSNPIILYVTPETCIFSHLFSDYGFFVLMLTGRSVETHKGRFGRSANLSQLTLEDAAHVRRTVTEHMDKTVVILRTLPKEMLLVFRLALCSAQAALLHTPLDVLFFLLAPTCLRLPHLPLLSSFPPPCLPPPPSLPPPPPTGTLT